MAIQMAEPQSPLEVTDHSRASAGLRYVYPVVSRRAQGLSIGINLNTNNACNWACRYCQVPNLVRGAAPLVDIPLLKSELRGFLTEVLDGDFMQRRVPEDLRRLNDIAFSGNGEPTASPDFAAAVECVLNEVAKRTFHSPLKLVVISNGSFVTRDLIQSALKQLAAARGELWFKLDRGLMANRQHVNDVELSDHLVLERLKVVSSVIPVWLQTCLFREDGIPPPDNERQAYVDLVRQAIQHGTQLQGVMLYTLARPSLQPGAEHLSAMSEQEMQSWAQPLREWGLEVRVSA
jgi:wyosine [tRNA(Phe)-imidazoG37] synthetase (radical SAM superfamily)